MIRHESGSVVFYQFASLTQHAKVQHAILTRIGGKSSGRFHSLNIGQLVGDDPAAVEANHDLIFQALGIDPHQVVTARQVHDAHVALVGTTECGAVVAGTDALVTGDNGVCLLLRFADCLPLMLYDPRRETIALVHVGWRGLVAGIVPNTLAALREAIGCTPGHLVAGLGPAIGRCCYEVGPDVVSAVHDTCGAHSDVLSAGPDGAVHLDLAAAVHCQLVSGGVRNIEHSGLCTACRTDEFFSHRAERGQTGRFAALLALRPTNHPAEVAASRCCGCTTY